LPGQTRLPIGAGGAHLGQLHGEHKVPETHKESVSEIAHGGKSICVHGVPFVSAILLLILVNGAIVWPVDLFKQREQKKGIALCDTFYDTKNAMYSSLPTSYPVLFPPNVLCDSHVCAAARRRHRKSEQIELKLLIFIFVQVTVNLAREQWQFNEGNQVHKNIIRQCRITLKDAHWINKALPTTDMLFNESAK
jgi:hypothetical protein